MLAVRNMQLEFTQLPNMEEVSHFSGNLLSMHRGIFSWCWPNSVILKYSSHESIQKGLWSDGRKALEVHKLIPAYSWVSWVSMEASKG